jgi:hypothetical protein
VKRFINIILVTAVVLATSGCLARQTARDGEGFRQAILDIYTDQVMDNLVRAREGRPFVQLTYSDLFVQDDSSVSASVQDVSVDQSLGTLGAAHIFTSVARTFSNTWTLGPFSGKRDRLMSFKATPITDKNDIYLLYMAFANDPSLFCVTDEKPKCGVHIWKKCNGRYYWVPHDAAQSFLWLVMKTTFMRGADQPPPGYYDVTVVDVKRGMLNGKPSPVIALVLDKKVKNSDGYLQIEPKGGKGLTLEIDMLVPAVKNKYFAGDATLVASDKEGEDTVNLQSAWHPTDGPDPTALKRQSGRLFFPKYPPPTAKPSPDLQKILDDLDAIRANVPRLNVN